MNPLYQDSNKDGDHNQDIICAGPSCNTIIDIPMLTYIDGKGVHRHKFHSMKCYKEWLEKNKTQR